MSENRLKDEYLEKIMEPLPRNEPEISEIKVEVMGKDMLPPWRVAGTVVDIMILKEQKEVWVMTPLDAMLTLGDEDLMKLAEFHKIVLARFRESAQPGWTIR